jgi:hypothetical protein
MPTSALSELALTGGSLGSSHRIAHPFFIIFLFFERGTNSHGKSQMVTFNQQSKPIFFKTWIVRDPTAMPSPPEISFFLKTSRTSANFSADQLPSNRNQIPNVDKTLVKSFISDVNFFKPFSSPSLHGFHGGT